MQTPRLFGSSSLTSLRVDSSIHGGVLAVLGARVLEGALRSLSQKGDVLLNQQESAGSPDRLRRKRGEASGVRL